MPDLPTRRGLQYRLTLVATVLFFAGSLVVVWQLLVLHRELSQREGENMVWALAQAAGLDRRHVYRPSSVYGATRSKRVGLVTALISNAMQGKTTRIFGNPNTLRDYVLADDIGHYLARRIVDPEPASDPPPGAKTFLLASGRSASVFEVIERIRERVERPLLLQFDPHPSNVRDMSFLPSALPTDWQATSLASGISRIVTHLRSGLT